MNIEGTDLRAEIEAARDDLRRAISSVEAGDLDGYVRAASDAIQRIEAGAWMARYQIYLNTREVGPDDDFLHPSAAAEDHRATRYGLASGRSGPAFEEVPGAA